ncbi:OmpA family protein [Neisseria wadsworthii]|nr:OmpA family protein [Neisseria wadsworthii]
MKPKFMVMLSAIWVLGACGQQPSAPQKTEAVSAPKSQPVPTATPMATSETSTSLSARESGFIVTESGFAASETGLSGQTSDFQIELNLSSDVLFDFDKAVLKPEAAGELQKVADIIREKSKGTVRIIGHTDSKGSESYNKTLSLERAEAVRNWLESQGVKQNYQINGAGAANPVAPNTREDGSDNPEGRAQNRRVEIIIHATRTLSN